MILAILLICSCSIIASAEEAKYNTAGELYEAWYENMPDYICGVWSTDGGASNLTFGIQNNESGKQKMIELVKDDSSLTFVYQEYSRNYLFQIQREIDEYMKKDLGLVSTGLNEQNNCIKLGILKDRKYDLETQNMLEEITERYGNAVVVEYTDEIYDLTIKEDGLQMSQYLLFSMGIVVVLLVGMLFVFQKRKLALKNFGIFRI
ncbi:MAG: hypothetical protein Q4D44_00495 [Eubacteriales bacterium]|nr:hypothetical protein [Eubacteriales bacterium]